MPEKIRKFYGKDYLLQFTRDVPEKEAKEFVKNWEHVMKIKLIKSDFYLNGYYYWIYARSIARDKKK
jgi:hypothetical protein